jgi:hypothetical protein
MSSSAARGVAALGLALLLSGCGLLGSPGPIQQSFAATGSGEQVNTSGWCGVTWQRTLVVYPYAPRASVEEALGFSWPGYGDTGQDRRDDATVFVCVDDSRVVSSESVPRTVVDLESNTIMVVIHATSIVTVEVKGGRRFVTVSP